MTDKQISILGIAICGGLLIGVLLYEATHGGGFHNLDGELAAERINAGLNVVGLGRR